MKEIVEIQGIKLNINHPSIHGIKKFFYNKKYEHKEITILKNVLEKSDRVFEIGAGIGFISAFCAKKVGNRVIGYEANPEMVKKIKETYKLNGVSPIVKQGILLDKDGEIEFFLEKNFWSSSTIKRSNSSKKIKIKTFNVNEEIKKFNPNFLIMDIEGGEKDLIPIIDFENINKLLIEFHSDIIGEKVVSNSIKYLIEKGFCLDLYNSIKNVCYFRR